MYAIFFDYNNTTYRLPTNPEEIEISSTQAVEKYNVLKLGQIAVATHMELKQYSFECEFPAKIYSYVQTKNKFITAQKYLKKFEAWRKELKPVRFIAGPVEDELDKEEAIVAGRNIIGAINTLILIEDMKITERAGEEGDKYVSFKLIEYKEFDKLTYVDEKGKKTKDPKDKKNPKNKGYYVVKKGDTLWAIAKKYYGNGSKYTTIYNANKDKIKNPNLIQPGWKLVIP